MKHFFYILGKPDNIPIAGMLVLVAFYTWYAFRQAFKNDRLMEAGLIKEGEPDRVHVFPYLVRIEMLAAMVTLAILLFWSLGVDAPLEEIANPSKTPNPSKAPWYFLGLQELLVYFDPWIAGFLLPNIIIVGLIAIPYIDINPKGSGYYSFKDRKFAILTFLLGFLVLWVGMIFIGTFMRGPGWYFYMPWEEWDVHKVVAITNVNLHELFGIRSVWGQGIFGAVVVGGYFGSAVLHFGWLKMKKSEWLERMGPIRYGTFMFLFLSLGGVVIKMILRHTLNIKYVWVTPWFNV